MTRIKLPRVRLSRTKIRTSHKFIISVHWETIWNNSNIVFRKNGEIPHHVITNKAIPFHPIQLWQNLHPCSPSEKQSRVGNKNTMDIIICRPEKERRGTNYSHTWHWMCHRHEESINKKWCKIPTSTNIHTLPQHIREVHLHFQESYMRRNIIVQP